MSHWFDLYCFDDLDEFGNSFLSQAQNPYDDWKANTRKVSG